MDQTASGLVAAKVVKMTVKVGTDAPAVNLRVNKII